MAKAFLRSLKHKNDPVQYHGKNDQIDATVVGARMKDSGGVARPSLPFSKSLFLRIESVDILAHIPTIPPVILSLSKLLLYIAFIRSYIRVKSAWTFFNPRRVVRSTLTVRQPIKRKVELAPYLGVAGACKACRRRCAILPHDRCRRRMWRWGCPSKTQTVVEPVSLALASVASRLGQACR